MTHSGMEKSVRFVAFTLRGCSLAQVIAHALGQGMPGQDAEPTNMPGSDAPEQGAQDRPAQQPNPCVWAPARIAASAGVSAYESLDAWTRAGFEDGCDLVFVGATGIAVRAIAPYVRDKFSDPAVACVDEAGACAVPLLSGHVGGANRLARAVAEACGGHAAVSTATDVNGVWAPDTWAESQGLVLVERDAARAVAAALLEGRPVGFASDWPVEGALPAGLRADDSACDTGICVSFDTARRPFATTLHLHPRCAVVGVGCKRGTPAAVLAQAVERALTKAGIPQAAVAQVATIDLKRDEPAVAHLSEDLGAPVSYFSARQLNDAPGSFASSEFVRSVTGTDNVCERAVAACGARLAVGKIAADGVTVAAGFLPVALSFDAADAQSGWLSVVGIGPGGAQDMTARARNALAQADVIVGHGVYVDLVAADFPGKTLVKSGMRREVERCRAALERAAAGQRVALVCSGDPGVYGMASLCLQLASDEGSPVDVRVVPGVTAATAGAAVLGAPLMHDFCVVSLSDLLTPWGVIERRLRAAAQADFVVCLYNPSSKKRADYLARACDILLESKGPETVCGLVRNIGRAGQEAHTTTLGRLRDTPVDMFTTVFVGSSATRIVDGRMVTPRGYDLEGGR